MKKISLLMICTLVFLNGCTEDFWDTPATPTIQSQPQSSLQTTTQSTFKISPPISTALARITKKPFGIKVSPKNSPVSPEKFAGFHTGTDFEINPDEENKAVEIYAICDGKLVSKKSITGYGGVAIQACQMDGQEVTVLYGHLKLTSIATAIGENIMASQLVGVLGKGNGPETSGERKHLHLGIHKGKAVNVLGYVQTDSLLKNWLDVTNYL